MTHTAIELFRLLSFQVITINNYTQFGSILPSFMEERSDAISFMLQTSKSKRPFVRPFGGYAFLDSEFWKQCGIVQNIGTRYLLQTQDIAEQVEQIMDAQCIYSTAPKACLEFRDLDQCSELFTSLAISERYAHLKIHRDSIHYMLHRFDYHNRINVVTHVNVHCALPAYRAEKQLLDIARDKGEDKLILLPYHKLSQNHVQYNGTSLFVPPLLTLLTARSSVAIPTIESLAQKLKENQ